jgi:transposase
MNPGPLQNQIDALCQQITSLQQALDASRRENTLLRQKLDALARRFFGKQSEHLDAAQLELLLSGLADGSMEITEEDEPPALPVPRRPRTHTQRIRTPENLEVVREVIEPERVQAQPEQYQRIGQQRVSPEWRLVKASVFAGAAMPAVVAMR